MDTGAVSVHFHSEGPQGAKPKTEVGADILAGIRGLLAPRFVLPSNQTAGQHSTVIKTR